MGAALKHKVFIVGCARSGTTWVRSILSQHEDLSAAPVREIRGLYQFIGLRADDKLISRILDTTAVASAKRMGDRQHVHKGEVGGWRSEFTETDRQELKRLAGDLLATLGYER